MEFNKHTYYIYLEQYIGSSKNARHLGASKILNFTLLGQSPSPAIPGSASIHDNKLISPADFSFELENKDVLILQLTRFVQDGKHISEIIVVHEILTSNGDLIHFTAYKFNDCVAKAMRTTQVGLETNFIIDFEKVEKKHNHVLAWSE